MRSSSSATAPHLESADPEADHRRPEGKEEQETGADRVRLVQQPHCGEKDDGQKGRPAGQGNDGPDLEETIFPVIFH